MNQFLLLQNKERIINYEAVERKRGCPFVENVLAVQNNGFMPCCAVSGRKLFLYTEYTNDISFDIDKYLTLRQNLSDDLKNVHNLL